MTNGSREHYGQWTTLAGSTQSAFTLLAWQQNTKVLSFRLLAALHSHHWYSACLPPSSPACWDKPSHHWLGYSGVSAYLHHLQLAGISQVTTSRVIVEYFLSNVDVSTKYKSFLDVLEHLSTDHVECGQLYTCIQTYRHTHRQTHHSYQQSSSVHICNKILQYHRTKYNLY